jgi:hypothetical protein
MCSPASDLLAAVQRRPRKPPAKTLAAIRPAKNRTVATADTHGVTRSQTKDSQMPLSLSFRFADDELNDKLIDLVKKNRIKHSVDDGGIVHFSPDDEDVMENTLICSIRDDVFTSWQVLSCPRDWTDCYREYMAQHDVPFHEELIDDGVCFLIPRRYRPNSWKLTAKKTRQKVRLSH